MGYNRYAYCLNNPLIFSDPSGYNWFKDAWNWFWNTGDNFAKWADKTDWFPSSGGVGYKSADGFGYQIGQGNPYININQIGFDPAQKVNGAINRMNQNRSFYDELVADYNRRVEISIASYEQSSVTANGSLSKNPILHQTTV